MTFTLTDRTFRVLTLARRQADRRSAARIETRDILEGLGLEGSGIAANVMRTLELPFIKSTAEEALTQWRSEPAEERNGPDELVGEARELMRRAEAEAECCFRQWSNAPSSPWIGTEHLLLAITTGGTESGTLLLCDVLAGRGLSLSEIRNDILDVIGCVSNGI